MKTLYIDCQCGIAGDMLCAALLDLFENPNDVLKELQSIGLPVALSLTQTERCGIQCKHFSVRVNGIEEDEHLHEHFHHEHTHHTHAHTHEHTHKHDEHHHSHAHDEHHHHQHYSLATVHHIIESLKVSSAVKAKAFEVYERIAKAESKAHGAEVQNIHFHEVGSLDAIADVVTACYLMEKLGISQVLSSPVNVGSGTVTCAHGVLPVPAPATAHLLEGVPTYSALAQSELTTPTGAALLTAFAESYGEQPVLKVERIGYGTGTKVFSFANYLRLFLATEEPKAEVLSLLECNVDDMTGEEIAFACDRLWTLGVNDVYTTPIVGKKGRPAHMVSVLCEPMVKENVIQCLYKHTTTLGIREVSVVRHTADRKTLTHTTDFGSVRQKVSQTTGKAKWEYEDIARIAKEHKLSLFEVKKQFESLNS